MTRPVRRSRARDALVPLLACLLATGVVAAKRPGPAAVPVVTAVAAARPVPLSLAAVGSVEPIESVAVRARVGGVVERVAFAEGDEVRAGQLLFRIDPRPFAAALAAAEARLERDRAQAENARVQADRYERLVARDYVTREQADAARTEAAMLAATVRADEAALAQARLEMEWTEVTAPVSGRTGAVLVKKGNLVRAGDETLVTINQLRPIRVAFGVPGDRLPLVRRRLGGPDVAVRAAPAGGGPAEPLAGRLAFVDNAVDPATGTVTLKGEFANDDGRLWPGQFVDVELVLAVDPAALTVPAAAVVTGREGPFVYVVGPGRKVEARPVTVDRAVDGLAVVAAGLAPGDTVVTDGQLRLVPGAVVAPRSPAAPAAAAAPGAAPGAAR